MTTNKTGLAVLIARPLALVLADLRIDLYGALPGDRALPGLPAIDQSRDAFRAAVTQFKSAGGNDYAENSRRCADFASAPGASRGRREFHDGLVGYFVKGQDAAATYRTFYAPGAAPGGSPNVARPPLSGTDPPLAGPGG